ALDTEADYPSVVSSQVLRGELVGGVFLKAGVVDPGDERVSLQVPCHPESVLRVLSLPQREGLQPLEEEEGVERAERRAQVPQELHPRLDDERNVPQAGEVTEYLPELQTVVARVRLGELGELTPAP